MASREPNEILSLRFKTNCMSFANWLAEYEFTRKRI